jgi:hypothetical protein
MNQEPSCAHAIIMTASPKLDCCKSKNLRGANTWYLAASAAVPSPPKRGVTSKRYCFEAAATSNRQTGWELVFWASFFGQSCSHDISHLDRDLRLACGVRLIFVSREAECPSVGFPWADTPQYWIYRRSGSCLT